MYSPVSSTMPMRSESPSVAMPRSYRPSPFLIIWMSAESRSRSGAGATPPKSGLWVAWMNSARTRMSVRIVPSVNCDVPYMGSTTTRRPEPRTASMSMISSIVSTYGSVRVRSTTTPRWSMPLRVASFAMAWQSLRTLPSV